MHSSFRLVFYLQVLGYKWPPWIYTHEVFLLVACFLVCFVLTVHKLIISRACFPWGGSHMSPVVSMEQSEAGLPWRSQGLSLVPDEVAY